MRLLFYIDKELLKDVLNMPESARIEQIKVTDSGMVAFKVEDPLVPEVPGIIETQPTIEDGAWSWNLSETIN